METREAVADFYAAEGGTRSRRQGLLRLLSANLPLLSHAAVWLGLAAVLLRKVTETQETLGARVGCDSCLVLPVLQHDSVVFGALLLIWVLSSCVSKHRVWSSALRAVFCLIALVYVVDVLIITQFSTRLFLGDVQEFSSEGRSGYTLVRAALSGLAGRRAMAQASLGVGGLAYLYLVKHFIFGRAPRRGRAWPFALAASCLLIGFRMLPLPYSSVSSWLYRNVFELNLGMGINQTYPDDFKRRLEASFRDPPICAPGRGATPNIILVVVEALSSYQSAYFSGLHDYTPELDRIARENTALLSFHANGFRTTGGMISLMTGQFPLPGTGGFRRTTGGGTSLEGFDLSATLPKALKRFGYTSSYLTTCDLEFSELGDWMTQAGFDSVEGNHSPAFEGWPRFQFDAPPDEALFETAVSRIDSSSLQAPWLLALATTTSHLPWRSPEGTVHTEETVMHYVDHQIGAFYDALSKSGFLDDGVLLITGDHRQMTPVAAEELRRFGAAAPAMIPMVVVWRKGGLPRQITEPYQQVDLIASLESLVSNEACRSSYQGSFLAAQPAPPACVLHVEGNDRDMLYARCGEAQGAIKMDGPRTRVVSGALPNERFLIDKINHDRALR